MLNKKAQVSIFIIIGVILVAAIVLVFVIFRGPEVSLRQDFDNPENFIDNCLRKEARETISAILPQGGFVNPTDYVEYNGYKVSYLCKNINYYEPCINQHPNYIGIVEKELENELKKKAEQCFILLGEELDGRGFVIQGDLNEVESDVILREDGTEIIVYRNFSTSRDGVVRNYNLFKTSINSPIYRLLSTASLIASQEAKRCYFEYAGYNLLYKDIKVSKTGLSDSNDVYTVQDRKTGDEINIAIRGCAIPPGF